jgi:hypothetical protein
MVFLDGYQPISWLVYNAVCKSQACVCSGEGLWGLHFWAENLLVQPLIPARNMTSLSLLQGGSENIKMAIGTPLSMLWRSCLGEALRLRQFRPAEEGPNFSGRIRDCPSRR